MIKLSSEYIVDIIRRRMALAMDRVVIRNQDFQIPPLPGLYVSVGIVEHMTMATATYMRSAVPENYDVPGETFDQPGQNWDEPNLPPPALVTQIEVNQITAREVVQIDIMSKNDEALERSWEVIAALNSIYSQQIQELNNFKIFRLPRSFVDTSAAEGGSQLKRYTITFPCFVWYRKETPMAAGDYYDYFRQRVDDEKSIGTDTPIIEFDIDKEGIVP